MHSYDQYITSHDSLQKYNQLLSKDDVEQEDKGDG